MPRLHALAVLTLLGLLLASVSACRRPSPEQCQEICWKYNELLFWEKFNAETADLGEAAKQEARAERQKLWDEIKERTFDPGLKNCIMACKRGGDPDQASCMEKATTGAAARACMAD